MSKEINGKLLTCLTRYPPFKMCIQYIVLNPHTSVFTSTIYKVIHSIFKL